MVIHGQFDRAVDWRPRWRIDDAPLVFVDLETAGLHPERGQRFHEVALVENGGLRFHRTTEPPGFDGDEERKCLRDFCNLLADVVVVGHNIVFDLRFIAERCERHRLRMPSVGFIDTLELAHRHLDLPDYRLATVGRHLDVDLPDKLHRAAEDARLAYRIFRRITDTAGLQTLDDAGVKRLELSTH